MGKRVLIIEDDEIILECIGVMLEAEGMEVLSTRSGQQGLELGRTEKPDLVVSDLHMPEVNGFDVLKGLKRNPETARVPFLVITADSSPSVKQRCEELGVDAFILKPFGPDLLMDTVKDLLQQDKSAGRNGTPFRG